MVYYSLTMLALDPKLVITDIGFSLSILLTLFLGALVFYQSPKKTVNRIFALFSVVTVMFLVSHIIGINISDPELSRNVLMLNMSTILGAILTAHWVVALVGRDKAQRKVLAVFYALAFALIGFYLIAPETFLEPSQPVLYFPNYYVQGEYYYLGDIFFYTVLIYFMYHAIAGYFKADAILKKRIRYVLTGIIGTYLVSITLALPLYGYDVDPFVASTGGLFLILIVYGLIKEELWDIHVIAKQALGYGLAITGVGLFIAALNFLNAYIAGQIPTFPLWLLPLISATLTITIARIVWGKLKQSDEIKYEFITVVTHTFRTPLTELKWSLDNLRTETDAEKTKQLLTGIEGSVRRLYELTEVLMSASKSEGWNYEYHRTSVDVKKMLEELRDMSLPGARLKNLSISLSCSEGSFGLTDKHKTGYAIQAVLLNAIKYTIKGGAITIRVEPLPKKIRISIQDTGIGIKRENLRHIFKKFYRTEEARLTDTEGLGIGLFVAKNIIEKQGGRMWAESDGLNKGSTFFIELPSA